MNKFLLLLFGLFASPFIFSQILTVNSESSVSIASGSSITLDGLEEETAWRQNFGTGIQYSSNAIRLVDDLFVRSVREF